ncbi:phage holin family protein [Duganella sp. FT109W]|jgi:putative membrane protein|uniref:Phage holin family protein n=2 Tax=Duganella TaxID=75654 RepID=A0A7X4GXG7_9BURK|nr:MULTISPECIES: phage holin family protein [Duganella]MYM71502.1 phage holin family protein [Duganella margarita]MYN42648.1 phage holin family protein [Duganella margarita]QJD90846.1 phage holin family protein [Duganella dendranthematis]
MRLVLTWLINAIALLAVPYLMHSVDVTSIGAALVAALVLGLVNTLIRPVLLLLTLPVTLVSLGLFIFIINGFMFWLVAQWVDGFHVDSFLSAVGGAVLYSIISWALSTLLLKNSDG